MINTAPNHKHTYDEQGRMTCCTLEEKIYTEAGAEQLLHKKKTIDLNLNNRKDSKFPKN